MAEPAVGREAQVDLSRAIAGPACRRRIFEPCDASRASAPVPITSKHSQVVLM